MDYPNRARIKSLGRATLVDAADDPTLVAKLHDQHYRAQPKRTVVIKIEAFDWNCSQHLPVALTLEELQPILQPFQNKLAQSPAENTILKAALQEHTSAGD